MAGPGTRTAPTRAEVASPAVERRRVSVLFVDLVGFTELASRLDPEETREFQAAYFARSREIVERYGGTVEKFIGDAVMAVWGAPTSNEDDPERAVRAGLDLVAAIPELQPPSDSGALAARAAVTTGDVVVTFGADGQGMVSGETVNLAARLQSAADSGNVITDDPTHRAAEAAISFEPAGTRELKGFAQPVATWRADRVVAGRAGSGRTDQLEGPFVGRSAELTLLKELFHATARERRLRVVSITGQAGIGKSRLVWEFEKYIDGITGEIYWHQGRSPAYGEGITFWALGEMVRRRAEILEGDDDATTTRKVREMLDAFVPDEAERARLEPALGVLLGLPGRSPAERGELFGAWRMLFERIGDRGPVVLVFEDLHWSDAGLVDFVGHLFEWSRQQPIFVVTLARPELLERFPTWGAGQRNFTSLHLEPLADADMRELLAGLVPGLKAGTVKAILRRAEGVPLYAVETVRMLVTDGVLVRDGAAYRIEGSIEGASIPASLHALVAARVDGLAPADRSILQQAAVLGSTFSIEGLAAVSGQAPDDLQGALNRLIDREILRLETDSRSPECGQYLFIQGVIREVAYKTLTRKDRVVRHLAAARYFESLGDEELAGALARHYLDAWRAAPPGPEAAALAAQARVALAGATDRAVTLHSYDQAAKFLGLALDVAEDKRERGALLERAAEATKSAGRVEEAQAVIGRAIELYRSIPDEIAAARAVAQLGFYLVLAGHIEQAIEVLEASIGAVSGVPGEEATLVAFHGHLARAYYLRGDHARSIELAEAALEGAEQFDVVNVLVDALITKGSALIASRQREAYAILFGVIQLCDRYGLADSGLRARNNLAMTIQSDDPNTAFELVREGLEIARRVGERDNVDWMAGHLVTELIRRGETMAARGMIEDLLDNDGLQELIRWFALSQRAHIAALESDWAAVARDLEERKGLMASVTTPDYRAQEPYTDAIFAWLRDDLETAEAQQRAAIAGDTNAIVRDHAWHGQVLARLGRLDEARAKAADIERLRERGRTTELHRRQLAAAIAAAEGRPEAVGLYQTVFQDWRDLGIPLDLAGALRDFVAHVGVENPAGAAAVKELRDLAKRHGWNAYLALVEPALAEPGTVQDTEAASGLPPDVIRAGAEQ